MSSRYRLSDEEEEVVRKMREERLKDAHSRGGKIRGQQIKEAWESGDREADPRWQEAKDLAKDGKSNREIARHFGVSPSTAWRWVNLDQSPSYGPTLGGKSLAASNASKEARIKGIEAIALELQRRSSKQEAEPSEDNYGMIPGEHREDVITEVNSNLVGIISDVHVPFHDLKLTNGQLHGAYYTALNYLREKGIQTLIVNGDFMDCYNISRHEKTENMRSFDWELDVTRAMLKSLREFFGDKVRIIYREGNHEERWIKYVAGKIPEVKSVIPTLDEMLKLRKHGIEWVSEKAKLVIGQLWVDHGHEWFGAGGVNPARAYRMKAGDNILVGHVHRTSFDMFKRPLDGSFFAGWSMGCLCDLNPLYAPRNHWNHGVVLVELEGSGDFTLNNRIIIHDKVR